MANKALTGGGVAVRIYEPSCSRVIIAGLEVIEAAFGIVVVTTVTKRVLLGQRTGGGQDLAVGVVCITCYGISAGVYQAHDIALQVGHIIIGGPIDLHGVWLAGVVVEEVVGLGSPAGRYLLLQQLPTGVDVAVRGGRFGLQNPVRKLVVAKFSSSGRIVSSGTSASSYCVERFLGALGRIQNLANWLFRWRLSSR